MSNYLERLQGELIERIAHMSIKELESFRQSVRLSSICSNLCEVDACANLPDDTITSIGKFLSSKDLHIWQSCCRTIFRASDSMWQKFGTNRFRNIVISGESFEEVDERSSWFERYTQFARCLQIVPREGVVSSLDLRTVFLSINLFRKVSCTLPTRFSVSTEGTTFVRMTVGVKFSPEAVRSVIGLIEGPIEDPCSSLCCDRGLSRKYWGLAFGPLTGVISCQGRYFDDFGTYRARHGLKDYLRLATKGLVTVQVGILVHKGKVAFFRLPERDYADWECTGFVWDLKHSTVFPAAMFSHLGSLDTVSICVNSVSEDPPYWPHMNSKALNFEEWNSFAEESLEATMRPPPNSPLIISMHEFRASSQDVIL